MAKRSPRYKILGMVKDEVDTCEWCGKHPIRYAVILEPELGGHEFYVGTECAAALTGRPPEYVRRKAAQEQQRRDKEQEALLFAPILHSVHYRALRGAMDDWVQLMRVGNHEGAMRRAADATKRVQRIAAQLGVDASEVVSVLARKGWPTDLFQSSKRCSHGEGPCESGMYRSGGAVSEAHIVRRKEGGRSTD